MTTIKTHNAENLITIKYLQYKTMIELYTENLKLFRDDACFDSAERLFHSFVPLSEKHFCPFAEFFLGSFRSVTVLRRTWAEHCKLRVNYAYSRYMASIHLPKIFACSQGICARNLC